MKAETIAFGERWRWARLLPCNGLLGIQDWQVKEAVLETKLRKNQARATYLGSPLSSLVVRQIYYYLCRVARMKY